MTSCIKFCDLGAVVQSDLNAEVIVTPMDGNQMFTGSQSFALSMYIFLDKFFQIYWCNVMVTAVGQG